MRKAVPVLSAALGQLFGWLSGQARRSARAAAICHEYAAVIDSDRDASRALRRQASTGYRYVSSRLPNGNTEQGPPPAHAPGSVSQRWLQPCVRVGTTLDLGSLPLALVLISFDDLLLFSSAFSRIAARRNVAFPTSLSPLSSNGSAPPSGDCDQGDM